MKIEVDSNIPIPARRRRPSKYPFEKMDLGDSFFIESTEDRPNPERALGSVVHAANKRYGEMKFRIAKVDGGARVWRVE